MLHPRKERLDKNITYLGTMMEYFSQLLVEQVEKVKKPEDWVKLQLILEKSRVEKKDLYESDLRSFSYHITRSVELSEKLLPLLKYTDKNWFTTKIFYPICTHLFSILTKDWCPSIHRSTVNTTIYRLLEKEIKIYFRDKPRKKIAYEKCEDTQRMLWQCCGYIVSSLQEIDIFETKNIRTETNNFDQEISLKRKKYEKYLEKFSDRVDFLAFLDLPSLVEPLDWKDNQSGGYLTVRRELVNHKDIYSGSVVPTERLYNCVNRLQRQCWFFESPMLPGIVYKEIIGKSFYKKGFSDLTQDSDEDITQKLLNVKNSRSNNDVQDSITVAYLMAIKEIVHKYGIYIGVFYTYQIDFRGRLYPNASFAFSPTQSKLMRKVLCLPEPLTIPEESVDWFRILQSSILHPSKDSYYERIMKVYKYNRTFEDLKKTYGLYDSWKVAHIEEEISNNQSYSLIKLDASASVYQLIAILTNDERLMRDTNLIGEGLDKICPRNETKFRDLYEIVFEICKKNQEQKEDSIYKDILQFLSRKIVKDLIMPRPYGKTIYTSVKTILGHINKDKKMNERIKSYGKNILNYASEKQKIAYENLETLYEQRLEENETEYNEKEKRKTKKMEWTLEEMLNNVWANIIVKEIIKAYEERYGKRFFEELKNIENDTYENPYIKFQNQYYTEERTFINMVVGNRRHRKVYKKIVRDKENIRKKVNARGANYVHSLDAFILYYVIENIPEHIQIYTIHDCIMVSPIYVPIVLETVQKAYIEVQNMIKVHPTWKKFHENGSIKITSKNIFQVE